MYDSQSDAKACPQWYTATFDLTNGMDILWLATGTDRTGSTSSEARRLLPLPRLSNRTAYQAYAQQPDRRSTHGHGCCGLLWTRSRAGTRSQAELLVQQRKGVRSTGVFQAPTGGRQGSEQTHC